jgi:NADH dehydrogenase
MTFATAASESRFHIADMNATSTAKRPRVVIVGGGFAGLSAAQQFRGTPADVTLVDRRNYHLFQPLLYQVATGELSPANIAAPLRGILRTNSNVRTLLGEVVDFNVNDGFVQLASERLPFDYLILAAGSRHRYFGNETWKQYAPCLKTVDDATEIRRRILNAFEQAERADSEAERDSWMTFAIVGGGPTGCELAGALAEVAFKTMANDFRRIDPSRARIVLIEPADQPLQQYPDPLPRRSAKALKKLGVDVLTGRMVVDIDDRRVRMEPRDGGPAEDIAARTVIWAAGVKASPLGQQLADRAGVETEKAGRIPVQQDCSIAGHPNVFVCGDLAIFHDRDKGELPCLAPVASQMGRHAAKCVTADIADEPRKPFNYFDKGSLAVIGRYHAVGTIGRLKVSGIVAWALWLFVHLLYVTQFRNRLLVSIQWGWTYFTHDRSSRLITGDRDAIEGAMKSASPDQAELSTTEQASLPARSETVDVTA